MSARGSILRTCGSDVPSKIALDCLVKAIVFAVCVAMPSVARPAGEYDHWPYVPGSCTLADYFEWKATGKPIPAAEQRTRIQAAVGRGELLEAYFWATGGRTLAESEREMVAPVLDALTAPLDGWESKLDYVSGDTTWFARIRRVEKVLRIRLNDPRGDLNVSRFSREELLRVTEILLVDATDHIEEARAERILGYQFELEPTAERFCRWRTFAHATHQEEPLREFEQATSDTLAFPEGLEDLAIGRLRRHEDSQALDYLVMLWARFPERARAYAALTRVAFKARLAELCEQERYDQAMRLLLLSRRFPVEVLDPDMATYAIYYKLKQEEDKQPSGGRQALLKFLLNHSVFSEASFVGEALGDQGLAASVPHSYRAIVEAQLGNAFMAYRDLDQAIRFEPPSSAFFFALGLATERFKNLWPLARRCYQQALILDPGYEPALLALAEHDLMAGDFDAAGKRAQQVLDIHPRNDQARYLEARVLYSRGDLKRAKPVFEDLAASDRAKPDDFLFLAEIALRQDKIDAARRWLRTLLQAYPDNLRAQFLLADCARRGGDTQAEIAALESVYARTRPWRFEQIRAARLFQLAADRLARLKVQHSCSPRFRLESVVRKSPQPFLAAEMQAAGPWTVPGANDPAVVQSGPLPRWVALEPEWGRTSAPMVWRDLAAGTESWQRHSNQLDIINPSSYEMLGVRVFLDGREFAYHQRLVPGAQVSIRFKSAEFPERVTLVYTTDTGFQQSLAPEGTITRRVDPNLAE